VEIHITAFLQAQTFSCQLYNVIQMVPFSKPFSKNINSMSAEREPYGFTEHC